MNTAFKAIMQQANIEQAIKHSTKKQKREFSGQALHYQKDLRAAAFRYTRNEGDAEDLVQETLLRAFRAWHSFQPGTNCKAWLLRILTNSFINNYRKSTKEKRYLSRQEPLICPTRLHAASHPEQNLVNQWLSDEVSHALSTLPLDYKEVVTLADIHGLSYKEIADSLNCPIGTVMSRLHRGRKILSKILSSYAKERGILKAA